MKIAISGKGGVGKTTLAAAIALLVARQNRKVLALDADPSANLAIALGIPASLQSKITPVAQLAELIEERTGAKVNQYGQIFKLNPEVSDIADKYAVQHNGVSLLVLGGIDRGGSGCACPENILIRALVTDLILYKDEVLIMDMEAGIEHLGRATSSGVDVMLVVVEPGMRSVDCARKVIRMARDIGIKNIRLAANKVDGKEDKEFLLNEFKDYEFLGFIPYTKEIRGSDKEGVSVLDNAGAEVLGVFNRILSGLMDIQADIKDREKV